MVNFDPDSRIVQPAEPSGTLTVMDGDTLWVRVEARDREELEGPGGGIAQIVMEMDSGLSWVFRATSWPIRSGKD